MSATALAEALLHLPLLAAPILIGAFWVWAKDAQRDEKARQEDNARRMGRLHADGVVTVRLTPQGARPPRSRLTPAKRRTR